MSDELQASDELATQVMNFVPTYYHKFLADTRMMDSPLSRMAFYGSLIETFEQFPLTDVQANELVVYWLQEKHNLAMQEVRDEAIRDIIQP